MYVLDLLTLYICQDIIPQFRKLVAYKMVKLDLNKIDLDAFDALDVPTKKRKKTNH